MSLTDEQFRVLRDHLDAKIVNGCPLCRAKSWEAHSFAPLALSPYPDAHTFDAKALPCAALVCQNCGNTVLINLVVAGVLLPHGYQR